MNKNLCLRDLRKDLEVGIAGDKLFVCFFIIFTHRVQVEAFCITFIDAFMGNFFSLSL